MINYWEIWARNYENAFKFFNSKGNMKTQSRLKDKWHNELLDDLKKIPQNDDM